LTKQYRVLIFIIIIGLSVEFGAVYLAVHYCFSLQMWSHDWLVFLHVLI